MISKKRFCFAAILIPILLMSNALFSQTDSASSEEEDFSQYENVENIGNAKFYCSPKIFDLSPNRFISIGYDYIFNTKLSTSPLGSYSENDTISLGRSSNVASRGLRLNVNIPVISKTNLLWQLGGGYNQAKFISNGIQSQSFDDHAKILSELTQGLKTININTTIFKPLNEKKFIIFQGMIENCGTYTYSDLPELANTRTSATLIYGKRPHDRLQWGIGLSRTYRAGELNYIPVVMYNYTAQNRKWGTEILFPARAAYRRTFSSRSILLCGYELEGSTYRINLPNSSVPPIGNNLELRRSEIRIKLDYQRQLKNFIWVGIQCGLRQNYSFNVDDLGNSNKDFFRGFVGTQKYAMVNQLGAAPYINFSINLVSP